MALPSYNTSIITAVLKAQQGLALPKFVMGGKGGAAGATYQLQKKDTTYAFALWESEKYRIGQPFKIISIKIPLALAVAANMVITPVLKIDDDATTVAGTIINNTNYTNSEKLIFLTPDNFGGNVTGDKNFYLQLQHSGSALLPVTFPIEVKVELLEKAS